MPRIALLVAAPIMAFTVLVAACSSDDDDDTEPVVDISPVGVAPPVDRTLPQPDPAQPLEGPAAPQGGVIDVNIEDGLFVPNDLRVPLGEMVTIRVINGGGTAHNLRLAGFDGQYETEDDALTEPDIIGVGETGVLAFSPAVPGDYTFRCDFHPDTMGGRIIVQ